MSGLSKNEGKKALVARRLCFNCTLPIDDDNVHICPRCGQNEIDERRARPKVLPFTSKVLEMPHPWAKLGIRPGGTVLISGGPGSGKTTITLRVNPTRFMTSEQEIEEVYKNWNRVVGKNFLKGDSLDFSKVPAFSAVSSWEEVDEDIAGLDEDEIIVIDSISQLGYQKGTVQRVIERIRAAGARAFFISQYTKDGEMLGPNELKHLVDVVCEIPNDDLGLRRLSVSKNRFGPLFAQYFSIGENGVQEQSFNYCYSVEGSSGNYKLLLYPASGAKFAAIFEDLEESGAGPLTMGWASASIRSRLYANGYAEPPDLAERKRFAESHGLKWMSPETARELVEGKKNLLDEMK